jgi:hypothetical protein
MVQRTTPAEFIAKAREVHGDLFDYSSTVYTGSDNQVTIKCREHGEFSQRAYNHLAGRGCVKCGKAASGATQTLTQEQFEARARAVHGDAYTYPGTYLGIGKKLRICCGAHGEFEQQANNHLAGNGCPACYRTRVCYTPTEFYEKAAQRHAGKYTYSGFCGVDNKMTVHCPVHGAFEQRAGLHLDGDQCPLCASHGSHAELDLVALLRPHTEVIHHARVGGVSVDVWLPALGIAIEHNGEMYHGDVSPQGKAMPRSRHADKQAAVEAAGARLIQLWGTEWTGRRAQCSSLLLNAVGVARPKLAARKCAVHTVPHAEAARFFDQHHIQGAPSSGESFGLYSDGALVACMTFSLTADRRGAAARAQELKLVRYAATHAVVGGAARLLAAGRARFPEMPVHSFSDPRLFTGGMYAKLGFVQQGRSAPDYQVWVPNCKQMYHKSAFQRSRLEAWRRRLNRDDVAPFDAATDQRTERLMEDELGVRRVYGVGLIKWVLE